MLKPQVHATAVETVDPEAALVYVRKRRQLSPDKSGRRDA
jgi:hypothetical protein